MIVADASLLLAGVLDSGGTGDVARYRLEQDEVHVPHLADLEVTEAARGWLLRGHLTVEQATTGVDALASLPLVRHGHAVLLQRVWSLRDNLTSYDACYVALAERLDAVLVTADRRLGRAPGPRCRIDVVGA